MNKSKCVLITGGAGYVGSGVLRLFLEKGYKVVCVDRLKFGGGSILDLWHNKNFAFYNRDIRVAEDVKDVFSRHEIGAVIHLAAIVGDPACKMFSDEAEATNWQGSLNLLSAAEEYGVERFVFASTCSNYGRMADSESFVDENSALAPVSLYAELKVKFEEKLIDQNLVSEVLAPTALRFSTVYGLSSRMRFDLTVNEFTKDLVLGRELVIFGEQFWRPYCHVRDFARAFLTVVEAPKEKVDKNVFNVGSTSENYTKKMLVDELLKLIPDAKIKYVKKGDDPRDYRVNCDKIKNELGFEVSATVPDGMQEIIEVLEAGVIENPDDQRFFNIPKL